MKSKAEQLLADAENHTFSKNCYTNDTGTYGRIGPEIQAWEAEIEDFILTTFGDNSSPWKLFQRYSPGKINGNYKDEFDYQKDHLLAALKSCLKITPKSNIRVVDKDASLSNLFERFHSVVRQLRNRYNNRPTLDVADEYDVQDLLGSMLRLYFDDVRSEEWTPSYAGGSSRMDFLLKNERIVIEVKKTRNGLGDRELGKQLIEDREKYQVHPDCRKLICFTYDPDGRITNPHGLKNDLEKSEENFEVEIIIKPDA